jgi:hypothetical protein
MDIKVEYDGRDYLVRAEAGVREQLMNEGYTVLGTVQHDAVSGVYFRVTKADKADIKAVPFKDTTLHKKPIGRWWED